MKVLIVEDDHEVADMVKRSLIAHDNTVEVADNGTEASFLARSYDYDAIVLDNALPKKNGLTVCKEVRAAGRTTPILFLSVEGDMETKISAFEKGADDYITKPFSVEELYARIKAVVRRPIRVRPSILKVADLELDTQRHTVKRGRVKISPTHKEFNLLEYFMKNVGIILSRSQLMEHVWTADSNPFSNTVEAHIRNLRKKIRTGNKANLIANIPGRGYVIDRPENLKNYR